MDFLSKLDPNLVAVLITAVTTVGGWLYRKAKGEKQEDITDALWHALEGKVIALADANIDATATAIRAKLTVAAHEALERMGVKRSSFVDPIVAKLVERGVTEVRKRLASRKSTAKLEAELGDIFKRAASVRADAPATGPRVPVIGEGVPGGVVRICPVDGCSKALGHENSGDAEHGVAA